MGRWRITEHVNGFVGKHDQQMTYKSNTESKWLWGFVCGLTVWLFNIQVTCRSTWLGVADHTCYLTHSYHTDTWPTSPGIDPGRVTMPLFYVTGVARQEIAGLEPRVSRYRDTRLTIKPPGWCLWRGSKRAGVRVWGGGRVGGGGGGGVRKGKHGRQKWQKRTTWQVIRRGRTYRKQNGRRGGIKANKDGEGEKQGKHNTVEENHG